MNKNVTIVTGLWDLGRGDIEGWGKRSFDTYKEKFFELLETDAQFAIWIPEDLREEVEKIREGKPTQIFIKNLRDFETWNPFFKEIQDIRTNEKWVNFAGWLKDSPQGALEYYNPMMFSKIPMVHDTSILNPFNSNYFYWIDGGLTSTVPTSLFTQKNVLDNLENFSNHIDKFTFIQYPYDANNEVHGFERKKFAEYCGVEFVNRISRGGFFGGHKKYISKINELYYSYMEDTLTNGLMGADECLFTILSYRHRDIIHNYEVSGNGLIYPFFENLIKYEQKQGGSSKELTLCAFLFDSYYELGKFLNTIKDLSENKTKILINSHNNSEQSTNYALLYDSLDFKYLKDSEINSETIIEYLKDSKIVSAVVSNKNTVE